MLLPVSRKPPLYAVAFDILRINHTNNEAGLRPVELSHILFHQTINGLNGGFQMWPGKQIAHVQLMIELVNRLTLYKCRRQGPYALVAVINLGGQQRE